ncbi:MAG: hypothetical protein AAFV49_22065, partial [Pseudomonadota bacterium]
MTAFSPREAHDEALASCHRPLIATIAVGVAADETTEGWDVTVEDAMVAVAQQGGQSVLRFRL